MKNIHFIISLFSISIILYACQSSPGKETGIEYHTITEAAAVGPYFTKDNNGNPVLCWTELDSQDSIYRLKYAIYDPNSNKFGDAITVLGSDGCSTASESMSKVAFKEDGTVVALFNKRFENAESRFASAIYYTLSNDDGQSWTEPQFIHSESSSHYGRSFFSISSLDDGEVGAIWLDGRFGDMEKGSALFFARTEKGQGFGADICLDKNTCECCRTAFFKDENGGIHIAYRGIQLPSGHLGKQVRDMVYSFSNDNGKSFSAVKPISKDNWQIEGCPHTGPSLAHTESGINALWFTGGGIPGLYLSSLDDASGQFREKIEMSRVGRHPQMVPLKGDTLAMIWDEVWGEEQNPGGTPLMDHGEAMVNHSSPGRSRIILTLFNRGKIAKFPISPDSQIAHHPVVTSFRNGVLAAWINEEVGKPTITYSFIELD